MLNQAGLPDGVLNVISHRQQDAAATTRILIEHPVIKKINFTGSTQVGRIIGDLAGKNLKPVVLELGGKAPAIVCHDADLSDAARSCALGAFLNCGQICMSTEKVLIDSLIYEAFSQELKTATEGIFGRGAGFLQSRAAVEKVQDLVDDAVKHGATLLLGSSLIQESPSLPLMPIIISNVQPNMRIYHTESFGPVVSLIPFESEEQAVSIANDTEYGLSAAVFTRDLRRGLRIARQIESGAVHINGTTVHDETALPHGGVKSSGFGRFGSSGLDEWVKTKTITYK